MPLRNNNDTINGLAISPGVGMGRAYIYHDILQRTNEYYRVQPDEIEKEWQRIENAIGTVQGDLRAEAKRVEEQIENGAAEILLVQEAMLDDEELVKDFRNTLKEERTNAEYIVKEVLIRWGNRIKQSETDQGKQNHEDVADLAKRLLREIEGISAHTLEEMPAGSVLVARRLLPSDTVFLSRLSTAAVVVEYGGKVSHAAILTRELGIPGVAQVENITDRVSPGDTVYVDGDAGKVVLRPDPKTKGTMFKNIESRWDGQRAARAHRQE
ncbi:MAG: phosphoenolpyruvate-utilizing N-terminal domain-containing protein, partial [Verrucomicrobiota bacterium]